MQGRIISSINRMENLDFYIQTNKMRLVFSTIHKNKLKVDKRPKSKS